MDYSNIYHMKNPFILEEFIGKVEIERFMNAVDDQLYKLIHSPEFYIHSVEAVGIYIHIEFGLLEFKDQEFAILWGDTIEKKEMNEFIRLHYAPDNLEEYFQTNMWTIAKDWVETQL